ILLSKQLNVESASLQKEADAFTQGEEEYLDRQYELEQKRIETAVRKHDLKQRKQEHKQRVGYARKIFFLISIWLVIILLIVIASGTNCKYFTLEISDRVLITLLTTTTITVLGLFI